MYSDTGTVKLDMTRGTAAPVPTPIGDGSPRRVSQHLRERAARAASASQTYGAALSRHTDRTDVPDLAAGVFVTRRARTREAARRIVLPAIAAHADLVGVARPAAFAAVARVRRAHTSIPAAPGSHRTAIHTLAASADAALAHVAWSTAVVRIAREVDARTVELGEARPTLAASPDAPFGGAALHAAAVIGVPDARARWASRRTDAVSGRAREAGFARVAAGATVGCVGREIDARFAAELLADAACRRGPSVHGRASVCTPGSGVHARPEPTFVGIDHGGAAEREECDERDEATHVHASRDACRSINAG